MSFSQLLFLIGFPWSVCEIRFLRSRTRLSFLGDFSCTVIWMVSSLPLISRQPSLFSKLLGIVSRAMTMSVTLMFYNFFSSLARSKYLLNFWLSFTITLLALQTPHSDVIFFLNWNSLWFSYLEKNRIWFLHIPFVNMADVFLQSNLWS